MKYLQIALLLCLLLMACLVYASEVYAESSSLPAKKYIYYHGIDSGHPSIISGQKNGSNQQQKEQNSLSYVSDHHTLKKRDFSVRKVFRTIGRYIAIGGLGALYITLLPVIVTRVILEFILDKAIFIAGIPLITTLFLNLLVFDRPFQDHPNLSPLSDSLRAHLHRLEALAYSLQPRMNIFWYTIGYVAYMLSWILSVPAFVFIWIASVFLSFVQRISVVDKWIGAAIIDLWGGKRLPVTRFYTVEEASDDCCGTSISGHGGPPRPHIHTDGPSFNAAYREKGLDHIQDCTTCGATMDMSARKDGRRVGFQ